MCVLHTACTQIGAVQGIAQFLCQLSKGVSGVAGDILGSQVGISNMQYVVVGCAHSNHSRHLSR
jgi:hypothetical protein